MDLNIVITTNGPGEIATWVKPVVESLRQFIPQARIIIALVPCPHSSGYEAQVSSQLHGTTVMRPQETLQYILYGKLPPHVVMAKYGVVLHLGGDQLFSVSLGMRTQFPVLVYTEHHLLWRRFVEKFLLKHQGLLPKDHHKKPEKYQVIGDIMVEAVKPSMGPLEARQKLGLAMDKPVVALLPGSKPLKVLYSTAWFLKIADQLQERYQGQLQFIMPQSPFTPLSQIREAVQNPKYMKVLDGVGGKIVHQRKGSGLLTDKGTFIQITPPTWHYNALQVADLSLTLPGTNTAELAVLGIPMLVLLPLNKPELLPLDGLANHIGKIPGFGKWVKKRLIQSHIKGLKYVSLPNLKAQRKLVPELVGHIEVEHVVNASENILDNPFAKRELGMILREVMSADGAIDQLLKAIESALYKAYPKLQQKQVIQREMESPRS